MNIRRIFNTAVFLILCSGSLFAQIAIADEENACVDVDYSLEYWAPDFYSFPGAYENWTDMYNTKSKSLNLIGEKILLLDDKVYGVCLDRRAGKVSLQSPVAALKYYTIVNYYVCREQIDSLCQAFYASGLKIKDITDKAPEYPVKAYNGFSLFAPSKKREREEFEQKMQEYNSLPNLPDIIRSEYYQTANEWNARPTDDKVIELMDEEGCSYYVDELYHFLPVTMWNNLLGSLIGCDLFIYQDELVLPSEWDPSRKEYCVYNKDFASLPSNYVCEKVEVNVNGKNPEVTISIRDKNGLKKKGKLGAGRKSIHTENGDEYLPYYLVNIDGNEYKMMSDSQFRYYKDKYIKLLSQRDEYNKLQEEERKAKVEDFKKKYGDYYGEQIGKHNVVAGMSKQMCIEAWGEPMFQRNESENNHKYEYLFYGLFFHKSVLLVDGKVLRVTEEK